MRSVWLDQKETIYYELLKPNQTEMQIFIHNDWLDWVKLYRKNGLSGKGKWKVILLHDNARQHVAKTTGEKIEVLGWEVLPRPAYSPDLAPSDYYLFWSMQHFFKGKSYTEVESINKDLDLHFSSKILMIDGFLFCLCLNKIWEIW